MSEVLQEKVEQTAPGCSDLRSEVVSKVVPPNVHHGTREDAKVVRLQPLEADVSLAEIDEDFGDERIEFVQVFHGIFHGLHEPFRVHLQPVVVSYVVGGVRITETEHCLNARVDLEDAQEYARAALGEVVVHQSPRLPDDSFVIFVYGDKIKVVDLSVGV